MKSNKKNTFEEWMDERMVDDSFLCNATGRTRKCITSIPRYNFAKEVWAAAGGKFKSDEVSDEV